MKFTHKKITKGLSVFITTMAVLGGFSVVSAPVYADDLNFAVNVNKSITMTIPEAEFAMNLDPSVAFFTTQDLTFTVGTNSASGYTATMSADSTELLGTKAYGGSTTPPTLKTLPELEGGYTEDEFKLQMNTWGYKVGTGNYMAFGLSNTIGGAEGPVNNEVNTVTFATNIDYEQPAGVYELTLNFAVVANVDSEI